jgi:fengycin family lipopeptide synthetase D
MKELFAKLRSLQIDVKVVNGKLDIQAAKGVVTSELLKEIQLHKMELIEFIESYRSRLKSHHLIPSLPEKMSYELSSSQRRLWILSQIEEGSTAYHMPQVWQFEGSLDLVAFENAFKSLVERHEILRTVFYEDQEGKGKQWIKPMKTLDPIVRCQDLRTVSSGEEVMKRIVNEIINVPFSLSEGPLFRAELLQLTGTQFVFCFVIHHIISDRWSNDLLIRELFLLYSDYTQGNPNPLAPLRIQYKEFAAWQQQQLKQESIHSHREFWLKQFEGKLPVLELPLDFPRPAQRSYQGGELHKQLGKTLTNKLADLSLRNECTLFMCLTSALNVLLYRYTNQSDLVIGTPMAGRVHTDLEDQVGFYINTLALRTRFEGKDSFTQILKNVKGGTLAAFEHQIYPFDELVDELKLGGDTSRNQLFDVFVVMLNTQSGSNHAIEQTLGDIRIQPFEQEGHIISKFDLSFYFTETEDGLFINVEYNSEIFKHDTITNLVENFERLLSSLAQSPEQPVYSHRFLGGQNERRLLEEFNNTQEAFPRKEGILDLFKEQVRNKPTAIAVEYKGKQLTYDDLDRQSNNFAHYLVSIKNIGPGAIIGVRLERTEKMIVSILAILKAGCAYLPIDPDYPEERISYMIADSGCRLVVDKGIVENCLESGLVAVNFQIDSTSKEVGRCCVIYTTGSSGKPKGIGISDLNLRNRLWWMWTSFPFSEQEVCAAKTSISFVDHLWEIFGPLLRGIKLVLFDKMTVLDTEYFIDQLSEHKITRLVLVPSLLKEILSHEQLCRVKLDLLKEWTCSGEALDTSLVDKFYEIFAHQRLLNIYGSTEVTADATYYDTSIDWKKTVKQPSGGLLFDEIAGSVLSAGLKQLPFRDKIINGREGDGQDEFRSVSLERIPIEEYLTFIGNKVERQVVNVASPKFIGHMTGPVPPIMNALGSYMISLNQNLVKYETSGIGSFIERQAIGMLHRLVYLNQESFYNTFIQDPSKSLGVITSGGTISNISALSYALAKALPQADGFLGVRAEGLLDSLLKHKYSGVVVIGSERCHYSIAKALKLMGIGESGFIEFRTDQKNLEKSESELRELIKKKKGEGLLVLALIGVAGSTESGSVDNLTSLGKVAREFNVHFHVDAAFGGGYLFSESLATKLKGIEGSDSVTICGHKQLYLPIGLSVCLLRDETTATFSENNTMYQARRGGVDLGKHTLEGSRPFLSLVLHGALKIVGKEGYREIIQSNFERAQLFKKLIRNHISFELLEESDLNIVLYRYLPVEMRNIGSEKSRTPQQIVQLNSLNRNLQKTQFEKGNSFVSYTELHAHNDSLATEVFLRAVLMNPYTTEDHLNEILNEQLDIAGEILKLPRLDAIPEKERKKVYIGSPISNTSIYVLSEHDQLVPVNVIGEICIGGECVTEGYLNHPELMRNKFIANPFKGSQLIYKTGDLGRWISDGKIEFVGRKDEQVKIRGHRIELMEVERALKSHSLIKAAAVIVKQVENEEKELVAYVVSDEKLRTTDLMQYLREYLPVYMIPAYFVQLDTMPLTVNGKTDKIALPNPKGLKMVIGSEYEAPRNELERKLVTVWSKVLKIEQGKIGVNDNYFELGGNSIQAIQIVSQLKSMLGYSVKLVSFYNSPTILGLGHIIGGQEDKVNVVSLTDRDERLRDMYFLPPIVGTALGMKNVAEKLGSDFNCYGLQVNGLEANEELDRSLEEIALDFSKKILQNQQKAEFTIMGYSFGALVAYELAKVLEKAGHTSFHLIMIDVGTDRERYLRDDAIYKNFMEEQMDNFRTIIDADQLLRYKNVTLNNIDLMKKYKVNGLIQKDILGLEASDNEIEMNMKDWEGYTRGKVIVEYGTGNHASMLEDEKLEAISDIIRTFSGIGLASVESN